MRSLGRNFALQGEILGPKIQGNKYKLPVHRVLFYNVFDIDRASYLDFEAFVTTIRDLGLETVPIISVEYRLGEEDVEGLVARSQGKSVLHPATAREGIVVRPMVEAMDPELGRLSFKVINPEFLLNYEE